MHARLDFKTHLYIIISGGLRMYSLSFFILLAVQLEYFIIFYKMQSDFILK